MLEPSEIIFALEEEIGNANIFTGRKKDIEYFQRWTEYANMLHLKPETYR